MKALGRDSRWGVMQKLRCRVKRTEPLPKMYALTWLFRSVSSLQLKKYLQNHANPDHALDQVYAFTNLGIKQYQGEIYLTFLSGTSKHSISTSADDIQAVGDTNEFMMSEPEPSDITRGTPVFVDVQPETLTCLNCKRRVEDDGTPGRFLRCGHCATKLKRAACVDSDFACIVGIMDNHEQKRVMLKDGVIRDLLVRLEKSNSSVSISRRLTDISSDVGIFTDASPLYNDALKRSGYDEELEYMACRKEGRKTRRNRQRNITWFNPPYSSNVATNIDRRFRSLVSKHFPKNSPLHKIFSRNTLKLSCSGMPSVTCSPAWRRATRACPRQTLKIWFWALTK